MASIKLSFCLAIIALLCVKACTAAQQYSSQKLHRREVVPLKDEKPEPTETSTVSSALASVRPPVENTRRECIRFEHTYCHSQFGYQYGLFPNHKGQTAEEAVAEFNDFAQLFNSGCSDKIGVFLCFTYFPLCIPDTDSNSSGTQLQEVLPCKETCEEVHKSICTEYVLNATSHHGWAEHLSCDQAIFKSEASGHCANGEAGTNDNKEPTEDNHEICQPAECLSKCVARNNCNRNTFKNTKNAYKFAAKVTVEGRLENNHSCKHAYNVSVEEQFNLLSRQPNSNELKAAPALQNYTIIHTSPANCEECPGLTPGSTYLIAGQYRVSDEDDSGGVVWELPNSRTLSLASKWVEGYSEKLQEWIGTANSQLEVD